MGYKGEARYVSFQWTSYGDEADYYDGRLGSSDSEASHALILDRDKHKVSIASVKEARVFLSEQWPSQPPVRMRKEEYLAMLSEMLKNVKQPENIDIEQIQRQIEEQYKMIEEMQMWLDKGLKN